MSIGSINSFGELPSSGSLNLDFKSFRRGESGSSENFHTFLSSSPFLVSTKTSLGSRTKTHFNFQENDIEKGFEEAADIIHNKRKHSRAISQAYDRPNLPIRVIGRENEWMNSFRFETLENQTSQQIESRIFKDENEEGTVNKSRARTMISGLTNMTNMTYNQGYETPKGANLDEATKQMIKQLQSRVVGLEKELMRARKENHDLKTENKAYKEKMAGVTEVQEKAAMAKDYYEREAKKLRLNSDNNQEIVSSLKGILSMQDEEYYTRLMQAKEKSTRSKVNLRKRVASTSKGTLQVSTLGSFEPVEGVKSPNKNRSVVKIASTKAVKSLTFDGAAASLNSLKSRKSSEIRIKRRDE